MATLRLFASVREAAGTGSTAVEGETVGAVIATATATFGPSFAALLPSCRIWRNGEPALDDDPVGPEDEIAVLPPVSGG
jgi:molybdopterin converting factor small subunit